MNQRITKIREILEKPLQTAARELNLDWLSDPELSDQLAKEIVGGTRLAPSGKAYAPDQFTLTVHPDRAEASKHRSEELQERIAEIVADLLDAFTYEIIAQSHITLATDPTLKHDDLRVIGWHSSNPLAVAENMTSSEEVDTQSPPSGAFLVVDGRRHFELKQPVIRIGRRLDNDLVLDDPHVSREHFRLIARNHRYLLEDVGSTAGTRVNRKEISEFFLRPGDVISIADIDLIYGEDTGGPPAVTDPYQPEQGPEGRDRVTPLDLTVGQINKALEDPEENE